MHGFIPPAAEASPATPLNMDGSWLDRPFDLTLFKDRFATSKTEASQTLRDLASLIHDTTAPHKDALPLLKCARFGQVRSDKGSLRHTPNMLAITGVEADYDAEKIPFDIAVDLLRKVGISAIVYTSPSHTEAAPRWRVLCQFSAEYPPERRDQLMGRLNGVFGGIFCDSSWTRSQSFYLGSVGSNPAHRVELIDGTPIDQHGELDASWLGKPSKPEKSAKAGRPSATTTTPAAALGSGGPASVFAGRSGPDMAGAAKAGLPAGFKGLPTSRKNQMLAAMLTWPAIQAIADTGRDDGWLDVFFALADAEQLGATEARALALEWCQKSPKRFKEADFDKDWRSFKSMPGGITIATLIGLARDTGFDVAAWFREPPLNQATTGATPGASTRARPPLWSTLPPIMDEAKAGPLLNQLFGFARKFGGGPSYFMRQPDGTVWPIMKSALEAMLAPYKVRTGTGNDVEFLSAAKWWICWPGRYAVDSVIYDPENTHAQAGETIENTYLGYAIEPAQGNWHLIYFHLLNIICGGVQTYCDYVVNWLAHSVQRPGTAPETMIVIQSLFEGVGKSMIGQLMLRIFGPHGHEASGLKEIFGEFNEIIVGKSFILLEEEPFPGNHKLAAAIKAVVTGVALSINPKGRPRYSIPNMLHMILTTNAEWAVPAGADARRFCVLDVERKEGPAHFVPLWKEINSGGAEAMLYDLLRIDLSSFDPRDVPVTPALVRQQRMTAGDIYQWIADAAVLGGTLVPESTLLRKPGLGGFDQDVPTAILYDAYSAAAKARGGKPKNKIEFARSLTRHGLVRCPGNNPAEWTVPDRRTLMKAAERCAGVRKITP